MFLNTVEKGCSRKCSTRHSLLPSRGQI